MCTIYTRATLIYAAFDAQRAITRFFCFLFSAQALACVANAIFMVDMIVYYALRAYDMHVAGLSLPLSLSFLSVCDAFPLLLLASSSTEHSSCTYACNVCYYFSRFWLLSLPVYFFFILLLCFIFLVICTQPHHIRTMMHSF